MNCRMVLDELSHDSLDELSLDEWSHEVSLDELSHDSSLSLMILHGGIVFMILLILWMNCVMLNDSLQ